MTTREKKLLYLTAMSFTQKIMKVTQAYKIFKKHFPEGRIIDTKIDGFNVVSCEFYDRQTGTFGGGEYIVTDEQ